MTTAELVHERIGDLVARLLRSLSNSADEAPWIYAALATEVENGKHLGVDEEFVAASLTQVWKSLNGFESRTSLHSSLLATFTTANGRWPTTLGEGWRPDALRILPFGRFGNSVVQLATAHELALALGVPTILTPLLWYLPPGEWYPSDAVRVVNGGVADDAEHRGLSTLSGILYFPEEFEPLDLHAGVSDFLRELSSVIQIPHFESALPESHLVIHLRGGDIFRGDIHGGYGQPPLAYYSKILASRQWTDVTVVFEDDANPVVGPLIRELAQRGAHLQSGSLEEDISVIMRAKTLVVGSGTFCPVIVGLSPHTETVYSFCEPFAPFSNRLLKRMVVTDVGGTYAQSLLGGRWHNTPAQREMMLTYPPEDLTIAPFPSDTMVRFRVPD